MSDETPQPDAPPRSLAFRSPAPINDLDGYVLAIILRLVTTGKTFADRTAADGVSVLTIHNVEKIVGLYSYFKAKISVVGVQTRAEFDAVVDSLGSADINAWADNHAREVDITRKELGQLFDAPDRPGFACYDG